MGRGKTAIGTLVERGTYYEVLLEIEKLTAASVQVAMIGKIMNMPEQLRRSIT